MLGRLPGCWESHFIDNPPAQSIYPNRPGAALNHQNHAGKVAQGGIPVVSGKEQSPWLEDVICVILEIAWKRTSFVSTLEDARR